MSKAFRKSVALGLLISCLSATSAFSAVRDGREGSGFLTSFKRAVVRVLDAIEIVWPKP